MTDRELLKLAAKAAGIDCDAQLDDGTVFTAAEAPIFWNALTDDGDALRLAVKLRLSIAHTGNTADVELGKRIISESRFGDPYTATRRAIVRAAAEIGKAML